MNVHSDPVIRASVTANQPDGNFSADRYRAVRGFRTPKEARAELERMERGDQATGCAMVKRHPINRNTWMPHPDYLHWLGADEEYERKRANMTAHQRHFEAVAAFSGLECGN